MIACYWPKCKNKDGAVMSVGVKRGDQVLSVVLACAGHVPTAMQDALSLAQSKGGRVASMDITVPARPADDDPWVNASVVIPRSEHRRMTLAAQSLRMSHRAFVRRAIMNQLTMIEFMGKGADDDRQA